MLFSSLVTPPQAFSRGFLLCVCVCVGVGGAVVLNLNEVCGGGGSWSWFWAKSEGGGRAFLRGLREQRVCSLKPAGGFGEGAAPPFAKLPNHSCLILFSSLSTPLKRFPVAD